MYWNIENFCINNQNHQAAQREPFIAEAIVNANTDIVLIQEYRGGAGTLPNVLANSLQALTPCKEIDLLIKNNVVKIFNDLIFKGSGPLSWDVIKKLITNKV